MKYLKLLNKDQSLHIRDIGFDDECIKRIPIVDGIKTDSLPISTISNKDLKKMKLDDKYVAQPTREQAFGFFRENYSLFYTPLEINDEESTYDGHFYFELWYSKIDGVLHTKYHSTYDNAENEALNMLIQLVYVGKYSEIN